MGAIEDNLLRVMKDIKSIAMPELGPDVISVLPAHLDKLQASGISTRLLAQSGALLLDGPESTQHMLPQKYAGLSLQKLSSGASADAEDYGTYAIRGANGEDKANISDILYNAARNNELFLDLEKVKALGTQPSAAVG